MCVIIDNVYSFRQRYHRGGTVPDSELTASQLRSRHNIQSNSREFSTGAKDAAASTSVGLIVAVAAGILIIIVAGYFLKDKL
jgi:hypothetical protein